MHYKHYNVTGFSTWTKEPKEKCFIKNCNGSRCAYVRLEPSFVMNEPSQLEPICAKHSKSMRAKYKKLGSYLIDF